MPCRISKQRTWFDFGVLIPPPPHGNIVLTLFSIPNLAGKFVINKIKKVFVVSHQVPREARMAAQAPAVVVRRQNNPNQKAMPIIGGIIQNISRPM